MSRRPMSFRRVITARLARVAAVCGASTALMGAAVLPYQESVEYQDHKARDAVLAQVLAAAKPDATPPSGTADSSPSPSPQTDAAPTAAVPEGKELTSRHWKHGSSFSVTADQIGAAAEFSGYEIDSDLDVSVRLLPALEEKRSPLPGAPVSDPFEITATDGRGKQVTSFPAQQTNPVAATETAPAHSDVTPGVRLTVDVTAAQVKATGADIRTLKLYTRETDADPWTLLPSYYDAGARQVVAESTHLSQFVVIGTPWVAPERPRVVLDPDQNIGWTTTPANVTEGTYNVALAQGVAALLQQNCIANVELTGTDPNSLVSDATRAGIAAAFDPAATVTLAFNTAMGHAWGTSPSQGGTTLYTRGLAQDKPLVDSFNSTLPIYTGRPSKEMGQVSWPPGPEFNSVPGAFTHAEVLYLDNNFDWAVMNDPAGWQAIVNGTFTSIGKYLETQGFSCTDPVTGGWPSPPSAAELARWGQLGYQNYATYGSEPVNFATGNLIESERTFTLSGPGGQTLDGTLTYNSQDGRLTRVGAGWSFGYGARAQRFTDGSVLVVRGDGASYDFASDGNGGYVPGQGVKQTLAEAGSGILRLSSPDGQSWVFDASGVEGVGNLTAYTDAKGRTTRLSYGTPGASAQFLPLTGITDSAGQTVAVADDDLGRVTSFALPDGRAWWLGYDGLGNLTSITDPTGAVRTFTYDAGHQLLTATDGIGATYLTNVYDGAGRVIQQIDADARSRTISYDPGRTTYTDQNGARTVFEVDSRSRITSIQRPGQKRLSYTYNDDGTTATYTDPAGRVWAYVYDIEGNVMKQTLPDGTAVSYTYDDHGNLGSITDQGGKNGTKRTTRFAFNGRGGLTKVTQPDGSVITQSLDAAGNVTKTTQPSGASTSYAYDARGNVVSQTDPDGVTSSYGYDLGNRLTSITDGNGHTTALQWTGADRLASTTSPNGGVTKYSYDANGNLTSSTDPTGAVTTYTWDHDWNLTGTTDPLGNTSSTTWAPEDYATATTDGNGASTRFVLDRLGRPTTTIDPNGGRWGTAYDGVGNVVTATDPRGGTTRYSYDSLDRLTKQVGPTGATTKYAYDKVGRVTSATDANGGVTRYAYDLMDDVTSVTDPEGHVTKYLYDQDGNRIGVVDANGSPTAYAYTKAGRVASVTNANGGKTAYSYDAAGNLVKVTDALGRTTALAYDGDGNVVKVTDAKGNATSYGYDANDRNVSVTDGNGHTSRTRYDAAGRVAATVDANGATTMYGYDKAGNQTVVTDPNGNSTAYRYDPAGQLTAVTQNGAPQNAVARYAYDSAGNLAKITDPNGHTDAFTYDLAGNLAGETNAAGTKWTYSYDPMGRLTKQTTPTGTIRYSYGKNGELVTQTAGAQTNSYRYDAVGNLIAAQNAQGVTGFEYDGAGQATKQLDSGGKNLGYSYDKAGQLTALTLPSTTGSGTQKVSYRYDVAGNVTSQDSPWGKLDYSWDAAGNLTRTQRSGGLTTDYSYDPDNRVTSILTRTLTTPLAAAAADTRPNTVSSFLTLQGWQALAKGAADPTTKAAACACVKAGDYLGGRTTPTTPAPVASGDALQYSYQYDAAGNVTQTTRAIGGVTDTGVLAPASSSKPAGTGARAATQTEVGAASTSLVAVDAAASASPRAGVQTRDYTYDALNRLASSTSTSGEKNEYAYDAAGNRTGVTRTTASGTSSTSAVYNSLNQVTGTATVGVDPGSASYSYDASGNRVGQTISGARAGYTYDGLGQLTGVTGKDRSTSYGYDALGNRVGASDSTSRGTTSVSTLFSGTTPVQTDSTAGGIESLIYAPNGQLALQGSQANDATWDILDRLGSTVAQAEGTSITQLASYDDWGNPEFESTGYSSPAGYTGQVQDPGHNLDLFTARAYDPTTATFTSQDVFRGLLTIPQSLHRYAYVADNPATLTDQGGYSFLGDVWNGVKKVAATVAKAVTTAAKAVVNTVTKVASTVAAAASSFVGSAASAVASALSSSGGAKPKTNTGASSATGKSIMGGYAGTGVTRGQYWSGCAGNSALTQSQYAKLHPNTTPQPAVLSPAASATTLKAGPCTLEPSVVWPRKSSDYKAIGPKPKATCSVPVEKITMQVTLYKRVNLLGLFPWDIKVYAFAPVSNYGASSYQPLTLEWNCRNKNETVWYARTTSTIVYQGVTYSTTVQSRTRSLKCGT